MWILLLLLLLLLLQDFKWYSMVHSLLYETYQHLQIPNWKFEHPTFSHHCNCSNYGHFGIGKLLVPKNSFFKNSMQLLKSKFFFVLVGLTTINIGLAAMIELVRKGAGKNAQVFNEQSKYKHIKVVD